MRSTIGPSRQAIVLAQRGRAVELFGAAVVRLGQPGRRLEPATRCERSQPADGANRVVGKPLGARGLIAAGALKLKQYMCTRGSAGEAVGSRADFEAVKIAVFLAVALAPVIGVALLSYAAPRALP